MDVESGTGSGRVISLERHGSEIIYRIRADLVLASDRVMVACFVLFTCVSIPRALALQRSAVLFF